MITQLTKDAIQSILSKTCNNPIVQLIQIKEPKKSHTKGVISDGFTYYRITVCQDAIQQLQTVFEMNNSANKTYPIIEIVGPVLDDTQQQETIIVVNIKIIYLNVSEIIASPIEYKAFQSNGFINSQGSNKIPSTIIAQNQPKVQQQQQQQQKPVQFQQQPQQQQPIQNKPVLNQQKPALNQNKPNLQPQQAQQAQQKPVLNNQQTARPNNNQTLNNLNTNKQLGTQRGPIANIQQQQNKVNSIQYTSLRLLNPSTPSNWKIKARVTKKNQKREGTSKAGKPYKLFSIDILDTDEYEVTCTFFGEAVTQWYDAIIEGEVYEFQNGSVKENNNTLYNKGRYVISFDDKSIVNHLQDDGNIQQQIYDFQTIQDALQLPEKSQFDMIAVIHKAGECINYTAKSGQQMSRREIQLCDQTQAIEMTLWREVAEFDYQVGNIIALKGATINVFNDNKSIQYGFKTQSAINPNIQQAVDLQNWYQQEGNRDSIKVEKKMSTPLQKTIYTIQEVEDRTKDLEQDKAMWHNVVAHFNYIKDNGTLFYISCPECKKKVVQNNENSYTCEKCNQNVQAQARYILPSLKIQDSTGSIFVKAFDEAGQVLLGRNADEIRQIKEHQEELLKDTLNERQYMEFEFLIMSKQDIYQGQVKINHEIKKVTPLEEQNETEIGDKIYNQILLYLQ